MEWIKTIIYGIVEGITEWLPISSTGHMILLEKIMPMKVSSDFWEMYLVVIQLGAILAVVLMFWNQLWPFCSKEKGYIKKDTFSMWFKIIVACVPAAVVELVGRSIRSSLLSLSSGCINVDIGWYRVFDRRTLEQGT